MDKMIIDYVRYGIYNNTLYFPRNKDSIKTYIEELNPLKKILEGKNRSDLLITLKNENPNIFTLSFVLSSIGLCDDTFEFLKKHIKSPVDAYIFITFAYYSSHNFKKYASKLYETADLGEYERDCYDMFKPNLKTKAITKEKRKFIKKVKKCIATDCMPESIKNDIIGRNVHYKDLGEFLSYKFNTKEKDRLIAEYIGKYGIIDILPNLDEWYCEIISTEMLTLIDANLDKITKPADVFKLLVIEASINNKLLKAMIKENLGEKDIFSKTIPTMISITPSQKHKTKINDMETYDYLYLFAVGAGIFNERFGSKVVLNGMDIGNGLFDILKKVNGTSVSLKMRSSIEPEKVNILFSSIMQEDFDVVWDSSVEDDVNFVNVGPLMIFGINYFTIDSFIKYIEEGKPVIQNGEIS